MSSDSDREQELRRLLADAVEPIEPSPGSQTRLLARARAQQRRRQRPLMERLRLPAAAVSLLAVVALVVVLVSRAGDRSNGSSATSTAAGAASAASAPSRGAQASSPATQAQGPVSSPAAFPKAPPKDLSRGGSTAGSRSDSTSGLNPDASMAGPSRPSDLDGDGRADTFTLSGRVLTANLSRDGRQMVTLPPVGPHAFVLFVSTLDDPNGQAVAVLFVRLRVASQSATDTVVALVDGRLTVLQEGSGPALLTIDRTHGYVCSQRTLALVGDATPFVVDGSQLVASRELSGVVAAPAKTSGC